MSQPVRRSLNARLALLVSLLAIVPLGYMVRFVGGGQTWLNDYLGSVAYEVFWILLVLLLIPRASPQWTAIGAFLATCGLEFLQLWHPPWLQAMRSTLPGRLILGNTFVWSDFWSYLSGSLLGWFWGNQILKR